MHLTKPIIRKNRFLNPWDTTGPNLLDLIKWSFTRKRARWPSNVRLHHTDCPPNNILESDLRITFVNHATFLIQTQGVNILVDPVWSNTVSPLRIGFTRIHRPGIIFEDLPKIDYILITHSHYDHLDLPTVKRIWKRDKPRIVSGLNMEKHFSFLGAATQLSTLGWWDAFEAFDIGLKIYFVPSVHWSKRTPWDQNKCLWGGFIIQTSAWTLYFAGDTGFAQGKPFFEIADAFKSIDIAFLPIGSYEPRWFMKKSHLNPEEAVQIHQIIKPRLFSIPFHFGTFHLADEAYEAPLIALNQALVNQSLPLSSFHVLQPGAFWYHIE
jgi:L-ascorbate metabolism protein UlaG (beta-lactamase superfamily)